MVHSNGSASNRTKIRTAIINDPCLPWAACCGIVLLTSLGKVVGGKWCYWGCYSRSLACLVVALSCLGKYAFMGRCLL
nr:hypothetical protein Q903MT_gene1844 [Picea sitchensis]